jgi:hypothetical protein
MDDNGGQLSDRGVDLIVKNVEKNQVPLIRDPTLEANSSSAWWCTSRRWATSRSRPT